MTSSVCSPITALKTSASFSSGSGSRWWRWSRDDAAWGRLALAGGLLHVWNHGLFKALLFFGAGSVLHATGTREMSRLGGLWRTMPWTAGLFALGAAAISGLPPLNGFVSEWLVYLGLFDATISRGPSAWAAIPAAILLGMTGALALACFVKVCGVVFLGAPRSNAAARAHECGPAMRGAMVVAGGRVRGDWAGARPFLAGHVARGGCVASRVDRRGNACAAVHARHGSPVAGAVRVAAAGGGFGGARGATV